MYCTLVLVALSKSECDLWVKGLRYLAKETIGSSYPLQMERWLWKEFSEMAIGERTTVTLKDVKAFLPQVNCQMTKQKLKEAFQEVDKRKMGELAFDEFASLYHILIFDERVTCYSLEYCPFPQLKSFILYRFMKSGFPNLLSRVFFRW